MLAVLWACLIFNIWNQNHSYLCSISQICHTVNIFISKFHHANPCDRKQEWCGEQVITPDQYKIAVMNQHIQLFPFNKWATLLTCVTLLPNHTASVMSQCKIVKMKTTLNEQEILTKENSTNWCIRNMYLILYIVNWSTGLLNSSKNTKRNSKEPQT
jgi:hypothetical protein